MPTKKRTNALAALQEDFSKHQGKSKQLGKQATATAKRRVAPKSMPWYFPNERLHKELKQLALDENTSVSKLLTEGIGYILKKRGKRIDDLL